MSARRETSQVRNKQETSGDVFPDCAGLLKKYRSHRTEW
jgi:hypothetical protein